MPAKLPKSVRKFLRRRKAEIRREILDPQKAEAEIAKLYQPLSGVKLNNHNK